MEPGNQRSQLKTQPQPRRGADAPLFDRLLDGGPDSSGHPPGRHRLDRQGLLASVERELSRLFNTRLRPGAAGIPDEQATVTGFGVPDWGAVNPSSAAELRALSEALSGKARAFEPRLEQVRVELEPDPSNRRRARGSLTAFLRLDWALEPVSFTLAIDPAAFSVRVPAGPTGELSCQPEKTASDTISTS
jgi:type VI secretion system lysozyme-like protein